MEIKGKPKRMRKNDNVRRGKRKKKPMPCVGGLIVRRKLMLTFEAVPPTVSHSAVWRGRVVRENRIQTLL